MNSIMNEDKCARIIANNLRRILQDAGKTQTDVCHDLGINKATFSSWMNGTRIPRMPKIDLLCHYFNITRAELMEEKGSDLINPNPDYHILSPDEASLLDDYQKLNDLGREKARDYVGDLTEQKKYVEKREDAISAS